MPDVTITSYKWRKRLLEFSPLCDNKLSLNRSTGLVDSPMRMNSASICQPACELCLTPYPILGNVNLNCPGGARAILYDFMELPAAPEVLTFPSQLTAEILNTPLTSAFDSSNLVGSRCFGIGTSISNVLTRSAAKSFVLRGIHVVGFSQYLSDWEPFGTNSYSFQYICGNPEKTVTFAGSSYIEIRVFLNITTGANCSLGFGVESRVRPNSFLGGDSGNYNELSLSCQNTYQNQYLLVPSFYTATTGTSVNRLGVSSAVLPIGYRINSQYIARITETDNLRHKWDPFELNLGVVGCLSNAFMSQVDIRVNTNTGGNEVVTSTPSTPWGWMIRFKRREV